ncbi:MAG: ABC transporter ATP-binding protein [Bdellovibrionales bacterium]|nr:ABC transporter ATP-binding protein [Bdellovibrionales bacterium]
MGKILSVDDLRIYFKMDTNIVKAVDGLSFDLDEGEILGVVGESGSGKSVTCLGLMDLNPQPPAYYPSGKIEFRGTNIMKATKEQLRKIRGNEISMIFQDPMSSLNPFLTVETQLCEVLIEHEGMSSDQARKKSIEMLAKVGIPSPDQRIKQYPHQFSGGMRQRVMIAMALLCRPKLLIADEPTTALDVTIQAQILELMRELNREYGTSIILITHDLGVVAGMSERALVMYAGKIVERASTKDLFEKPQHPYTHALLKSIPKLTDVKGKSLDPIPGLPPDLSNLPTGCSFHPRCSRAVEKCKESYPEVVTLDPTHKASCWEVNA